MSLPDGVSRWRIFLFWRDVCDFVSGGEGVGKKGGSSVGNLYGYIRVSTREHASRFLTFITSLISRVELFTGVTPGYIFGEDHLHWTSMSGVNLGEPFQRGTVSPHAFFLSADAGLSLVIRIWRMSINVTPAVHYYITDNYRLYNAALKQDLSSPVRWQMSLSGGVNFMF